MKKIIIYINLLIGNTLWGLDAETIKQLEQCKHNRTKIIDELKIDPDVRIYELEVLSGKSDSELKKDKSFIAREKVMNGHARSALLFSVSAQREHRWLLSACRQSER